MARRKPFKPAVDTICDLHAFMPGSVITAKEFRRESLSQWARGPRGEREIAGFFKWAKRYELLEQLPGRKYRITAKGMRVAKKACKR